MKKLEDLSASNLVDKMKGGNLYFRDQHVFRKVTNVTFYKDVIFFRNDHFESSEEEFLHEYDENVITSYKFLDDTEEFITKMDQDKLFYRVSNGDYILLKKIEIEGVSIALYTLHKPDLGIVSCDAMDRVFHSVLIGYEF